METNRKVGGGGRETKAPFDMYTYMENITAHTLTRYKSL